MNCYDLEDASLLKLSSARQFQINYENLAMLVFIHSLYTLQGPSTWRMIHAMDLNNQRELALTADNFGFLYQ